MRVINKGRFVTNFGLIFTMLIPLFVMITLVQFYNAKQNQRATNFIPFFGSEAQLNLVRRRNSPFSVETANYRIAQLQTEGSSLQPVNLDFSGDSLIFTGLEGVNFMNLNSDDQNQTLQFVNDADQSAIKFDYVLDQNQGDLIGIKKDYVGDNSYPFETSISIYDVKSGLRTIEIQNPVANDGQPYSLFQKPVLSPSNKFLTLFYTDPTSNFNQKLVRIYDLEEKKIVREFNTNSFQNYEFDNQNRYLAVNQRFDNQIEFYSLTDASKDFSLKFETSLYLFQFIEDEKILTLSFFDPRRDFDVYTTVDKAPTQIIRTLNFLEKNEISKVLIQTEEVLKVMKVKDKNVLIMAKTNGELDFFDTTTNSIISSIKITQINEDQFWSENIFISSNGKNLIHYNKNNQIEIWDLNINEKQCLKFEFSLKGFNCLFKSINRKSKQNM